MADKVTFNTLTFDLSGTNKRMSKILLSLPRNAEEAPEARLLLLLRHHGSQRSAGRVPHHL